MSMHHDSPLNYLENDQYPLTSPNAERYETTDERQSSRHKLRNQASRFSARSGGVLALLTQTLRIGLVPSSLSLGNTSGRLSTLLAWRLVRLFFLLARLRCTAKVDTCRGSTLHPYCFSLSASSTESDLWF